MHTKSAALALAMMLVLAASSPIFADDPYNKAVEDAKNSRTIRNDAIFSGLTVINSSKTRTLVVDDGAGGTKTIQAVKVITLTNFTTPYNNATYLKRYVVDATSYFRANLWVTVEGDEKNYLVQKNIPITNNTDTTDRMLESLGMNHYPGYQVLSIWVDPKYITRPSYDPDIASNGVPVWNESEGRYDFTNVNSTTLPNFLGIAPVTKVAGKYVRPFDTFVGTDQYRNWLNAWSTASYDIGGGREFPYTALGWTWNWNPDPNLNGFALSEFLVNGNGEYYFAGLRPTLGYLFPIIAENANESSVADALNDIYDFSTGDMHTALENIVALNDGPTIAQTFDEISPARLNSVTDQVFLGFSDIADITADRLGCCPWVCADGTCLNPGSNRFIWADYLASWTKDTNRGDHLGNNNNSNAVILGIEKRSDASTLGLAFSYTSQNLTWNNSEGNADVNFPIILGYSGRRSGNWMLAGELGLGFINNDTTRYVNTISEDLRGNNSSVGILAGFKACMPINRGSWTFAPSIGLQYTNLWENSYSESGGAMALDINSRQVDYLCGELRVCAAHSSKNKKDLLNAQSVNLRWLPTLSKRSNQISGSFVSSPAAAVVGTDYAVPASMIEAGIGASFEVARNRTIQLSYDYWFEINGTITRQDVDIKYAVGF